MSTIITSYPDRVVNGNNETLSKWSAVHHPVKFGMQRRDLDGAVSVTGETFTFVGAVGTVMSNLTQAGETLYFESPNDSGTALITSISNHVISGTVIESTHNSINSVGFVNLFSRVNFFVKTNVYKVSPNLEYILIGTLTSVPDSKGSFNVDVSSFLKSLVDYENTFAYDKLNKTDNSLGGRYNITTSENWVGHEGVFSTMDETRLRYFTNSAKQIQDLYGENMGQYVPFREVLFEDSKALFLSDFTSPTYFPGFPFDLSFINSDSIYPFDTEKHEQKRDLNGVNEGVEVQYELDKYEKVGVSRLMLAENYAANVKDVLVWIELNIEAIEFLGTKDDLVADGYLEELEGLEIVNSSQVRQVPDPVMDSNICTEAFVPAFV